MVYLKKMIGECQNRDIEVVLTCLPFGAEEFRYEEANTAQKIAEEYGDVLFSMVNVGRFLDVTPEIELMSATKKFTDRFCEMERLAREKNQSLDELNLAQMEKLWVKTKEKH